MRQSYNTKSVCVVDNGLFVELAATLAPSFGRTFYYSPWEAAFPKSNVLLVGTGLEGVTRIDHPLDYVDEVDLWVFPDVYQAPLQAHLEGLGKRVWGSRYGEELELDRPASKEHLRSLGLSIGPWQEVRGLDALRVHLKQHENQWVKVSRTRGDMESFHAENYKLIEPRLDELEHSLGAKKTGMRFVVEDGIDDAVEIGYDGYTVDGVFPHAAMCGIELKDKGYIGHFMNQRSMPPQLRSTNFAVADTLKKYRYRNFLTLEMRITEDGTPWIIDPCCRMGSPPGELVQMMYTNLAEILWQGGEGKCVDPIPAAPWGAELLIHSGWADKNWQAIQFPEDLREHIKFRNLAVLHGEHYVVPQAVGLPEIGAIVAVGETCEAACEAVKEIAAEVRGYFLDVFPDSLDEASESMATLAEFGIDL